MSANRRKVHLDDWSAYQGGFPHVSLAASPLTGCQNGRMQLPQWVTQGRNLDMSLTMPLIELLLPILLRVYSFPLKRIP